MVEDKGVSDDKVGMWSHTLWSGDIHFRVVPLHRTQLDDDQSSSRHGQSRWKGSPMAAILILSDRVNTERVASTSEVTHLFYLLGDSCLHFNKPCYSRVPRCLPFDGVGVRDPGITAPAWFVHSSKQSAAWFFRSLFRLYGRRGFMIRGGFCE